MCGRKGKEGVGGAEMEGWMDAWGGVEGWRGRCDCVLLLGGGKGEGGFLVCGREGKERKGLGVLRGRDAIVCGASDADGVGGCQERERGEEREVRGMW